ncbi:ATP-binding cassette domain-containing protein [Euzebya sp.]|uniref:ABC transporter ATP-binding protein n=1 Tax=Euzebya sp. TaxID=1971409 RepID=UPI0035163A7B
MPTIPLTPATAHVPLRGADDAFALALEGVRRSYGHVEALAPLTLRLSPGTVCAVTGSNGSGKTTLLRIAAGLLQPSGGVRRGRTPALYARAGGGARPAQTVGQAVAFAASLGGGDADEAVAVTRLAELCSSRVGELSAGQRARVALAVVVAADPAVACLDEPDAHLDEASRRCAGTVIEVLAGRGCAVLVATHARRWLDGHCDAEVRLVSSSPTGAA